MRHLRRKLKELKLYEYSLVTFPMNTMAMATAAKQFNQWLKSLDADESLLVKEPLQTELQFQLVDLRQRLIRRLRVRKGRISGHDPAKDIKTDRGELGGVAHPLQLAQAERPPP